MSDSSELMLLIQAERMLAKATGKHMRLPPRNRLALSEHTIQPAQAFFSQPLPRGPPSANTTSCQLLHFFERLYQGGYP